MGAEALLISLTKADRGRPGQKTSGLFSLRPDELFYLFGLLIFVLF
jgi:hypothetical protein